jgi:hypothetical protein
MAPVYVCGCGMAKSEKPLVLQGLCNWKIVGQLQAPGTSDNTLAMLAFCLEQRDCRYLPLL